MEKKELKNKQRKVISLVEQMKDEIRKKCFCGIMCTDEIIVWNVP